MSDSIRGRSTEPPSPYRPMPSQQHTVDGYDEPSVLEQDYPDDAGEPSRSREEGEPASGQTGAAMRPPPLDES